MAAALRNSLFQSTGIYTFCCVLPYDAVWEVSSTMAEFSDKEKFALKIQSKHDTSRSDYSAIEAIRRECEVLASVDHPFIVDLVHHYEDEVRGIALATHSRCFSPDRTNVGLLRFSPTTISGLYLHGHGTHQRGRSLGGHSQRIGRRGMVLWNSGGPCQILLLNRRRHAGTCKPVRKSRTMVPIVALAHFLCCDVQPPRTICIDGKLLLGISSLVRAARPLQASQWPRKCHVLTLFSLTQKM